jgi:CrcB protein
MAMISWEHSIAIFIGGGIGAVLRAWVSSVSGTGIGTFDHIPLGTLWVNWGGSFLLGFLIGALPGHSILKSGLTTGMMGGLTTFSTLSIENIKILQNHNSIQSGLHLLLHCGGGLFFAFIGLSLGSTLGKQGK